MELIDRKKAIREIDEMIKDLDSWKDYTRLEMVNYLCCMIRNIPTTDGLVHAKWIGEEYLEGDFPNDHTCQECSNCHKVRTVDEYCSNCGAKMDVEED